MLGLLCACDPLARVDIIDPNLPEPVFCVSARSRCALDGPNYHGNTLQVTARPADEPDATPTVVWSISSFSAPNPQKNRHLHYGELPMGWTEEVECQPLQPEFVYRFQNISFVVEGGQIVEIRE
ncbi:MAG TPA: hypothetical protein VK034_07520 [Enhygromyxa sp.]|nr:hypothetical protein [Enhygromyxa sp.]